MRYFAIVLAYNILKLSKIPLTDLHSLVFLTILKWWFNDWTCILKMFLTAGCIKAKIAVLDDTLIHMLIYQKEGLKS